MRTQPSLQPPPTTHDPTRLTRTNINRNDGYPRDSLSLASFLPPVAPLISVLRSPPCDLEPAQAWRTPLQAQPWIEYPLLPPLQAPPPPPPPHPPLLRQPRARIKQMIPLN